MNPSSSSTIVTAHGSNYFGLTGFPIKIGRSTSDQPPSNVSDNPHDLTEIEHTHDFNELVIVKQGRALQRLEGTDLPIASGDVFLLQGQQKHYFHHRDRLELINIMYDPKRIFLPESDLRRMPGYCALFLLEPNYRQQHRFASHLHLSPIELAFVEQFIVAMEQECQEQALGFEVALQAKLLELIVYLSRQYLNGESVESQALLRVGNVIGALENDSARDWKLDELAEIAHMSKSNLLTTFRKATSYTPIDYLTHIRIQKSIELLSRSNLSITEIAYAVGFNDSNYFTRRFRKANGLTPRAYRTQFSHIASASKA